MVNAYRHLTKTKLQRLYNREMRRAERNRLHGYFSLERASLAVAESVAQELDSRNDEGI